MKQEKVIRMSNGTFADMIAECVLRTLYEGEAWQAFAKGFNGAELGKYAYGRIVNGNGESKLGKPSNEEEQKAAFEDAHDYTTAGGAKDHEAFKEYRVQKNKQKTSGSTSSNTSSSSTSTSTPTSA